MNFHPQNINGEFKLHDYRDSKERLKELEAFLAKKDWQLTICDTFMPGSDYGQWYEVFDLSDLSNKQAVERILYYHDHESFRDFSYIFICHSPHKVNEEARKHKRYSYFDYHVVGRNGNDLLDYLERLIH